MMGFIYPWISIKAWIDHDPVDEVAMAPALERFFIRLPPHDH